MKNRPNITMLESTLIQIESQLRIVGTWDEFSFSVSQIVASDAAFCADIMTFPQWLQHVLLPRVRALTAGGEAYPDQSMVGAQAIREFDGVENSEELVRLLIEFDRYFNESLDANGFYPGQFS